jgi:hypothetical protein
MDENDGTALRKLVFQDLEIPLVQTRRLQILTKFFIYLKFNYLRGLAKRTGKISMAKLKC